MSFNVPWWRLNHPDKNKDPEKALITQKGKFTVNFPLKHLQRLQCRSVSVTVWFNFLFSCAHIVYWKAVNNCCLSRVMPFWTCMHAIREVRRWFLIYYMTVGAQSQSQTRGYWSVPHKHSPFQTKRYHICLLSYYFTSNSLLILSLQLLLSLCVCKLQLHFAL